MDRLFDLAKIVKIIRNRKFQRVVLQFPDESLQNSVSIYTTLVENLPSTRFFITADSTYGSSVDDISAQHIQSDLIIHFGDDLSSSGSVPVLVAPALKRVDLGIVVPKMTSATRSMEIRHGLPIETFINFKILLLYEAGLHQDMELLAASACEQLQLDRSVMTIARLPPCADLDTWCKSDGVNEESLNMNSEDIGMGDKIGGLNLTSSSLNFFSCNEDHEQNNEVAEIVCQQVVWFIGDKKQQLMSIILRMGNVPVVAYFPSSDIVQIIKGHESREFGERFGGVSKVEDAKIIGIIVGSMGLSRATTRSLLHRLENLVMGACKKYYTFIMGRLNEAKLCNFPEVDIYCLVSSDDCPLIKPKTFYVPVITPYELELGLGAHTWSAIYLNTSSCAYREMDLNLLMTKVERNRPANRYEDDEGTRDNYKIPDSMSNEILNINEEKRITESFQSDAADLLLRRGYQGMEFSMPKGSARDVEVKCGQFGTASEYFRSSGKL